MKKSMRLHRTSLIKLLVAGSLIASTGSSRTLAQSIVPAADGTNTRVLPDGNRFNITGGSKSRDGANLFHSFEKFGLTQNQIAIFQSNPAIRNIFSRINGGDASFINGLISVNGGHSNLFLMNPAGIVFGANARLDVPASFLATTASGIGFGSNWLNAEGANNYASLVGTPSTFAFTMSQPGAVLNFGDLAVKPGQNLTLLAGTTLSTGTLSAPGGNLTVAAVPGESLVRISEAGMLLGLEIQPLAGTGNQPGHWTLPVASLPQLLTGGGEINHANDFVVNNDGTVQLVGSGIRVDNNDVVVRQVTAGTATLAAGHNLTLVESRLSTIGDLNLLAGDTLRVRDSVANPFVASAGGRLLVQGNQNVDIFALNNPSSGLYAGGDLVLRSNQTVGGDAHYSAGGNFKIETLDGKLGKLFSPYDPVIRAAGDVEFGSYTGASLHIFAGGSVKIAENVTITGPDAANSISEEVPLSGNNNGSVTINGGTQATLDIRAGTTAFGTAGITGETGNFTGEPTLDINKPASGANITIGNIDIAVENGRVFLTNQNPDTESLGTGTISTRAINGLSSSVTIDSQSNITITGGINTSSNPATTNPGGDIKLISGGAINTSAGSIDSSAPGSGAGAINLSAVNEIITGNITGGGGGITLNSSSGYIDTSAGFVDTGTEGVGGPITLSASGNITTGDVNTGGDVDGNTITITSSSGVINTSAGTLTSGLATGSSGDITVNSPQEIIPGNIDSTSSEGAGSIRLNGPVTLIQDVSISAGGAITFTNTIDGNHQLTLNAGGTIWFQRAVGGSVPIEGLTIVISDNVTVAGGITTSNSDLIFSENANSVILTGDTTFNAGTARIELGTQLTAGPHALTLIADEIDIVPFFIDLVPIVIDATGPITLQPFTPNRPIEIAGDGDTPNTLNLTLDEINDLRADFSSITIGGPTAGPITVVDDVTFNNSVKIQALADSGSITANGAITGELGSGNLIELEATRDITTGDITGINRTITLTSHEGAINTSAGFLNSGSGADDTGSGPFRLSAAGNITTGDITGSSITLNSTNGTIDTSAGSLNGGGGVELTSGGKITTGDVNSGAQTAGSITITSTGDEIDTSAGTLDATGGETGGNVTLNSSNKITPGNIDVQSEILQGGNIEFNGPVVLPAKNISLTTGPTSGTITFNDKLDGNLTANSTLSLNAGTDGIIQFKNVVGGFTPLGGLNMTTTGSVEVGEDITTANSDLIFNSPVRLTNNARLNAGTGTISFNDTLAAGANALTLTADEINFSGGANSVTGSSSIWMQPFTAARNIEIAGNGLTANTLNLTAAELGSLADGFNSITIGGLNSAGILSIANPILFNDSVTLHSPNGSIAVNSLITGAGNAAVTLNGPTTLNAGITTADQNITINGNTSVGGNVTLSTGAAGAGNILLNGTVNGNSNLTLEAGTGNITLSGAAGSLTPLGNLTLSNANNVTTQGITANSITQISGTGTTTFNGALNTNTANGINLTGNNFTLTNPVTTTNAGGVTINNSGLLNIAPNADMTLAGAFLQNGGGAVVTGGNITGSRIEFSSPLALSDNVLLNTSAGNGNIIFNNTVNATNSGVQSLTLAAGTGNISFNSAVGNTTALNNLTVNSANNATTQTITANSITQTSGAGTTAFNGALETNSAAGINLTGNNFTLNSPVATVNGGGLTINNSGTLNIPANAALNLDGGFSQTGTGAVSVAGSFVTNNSNISFSGPVNLTGDVSLNTGAGNGNITFNSTVNGNQNLNLSSGSGNIFFNNSLGKTTPLNSLNVNSDGNIFLSNNVRTLGDILFNAPLTLQNSLTLDTSAGNGNIIVNNTVNATNPGVQNLSLAAGTGNITFNNSIGNINRLGDLTINSAGNLITGAITANSITQTSGSGTTTFNGAVNTNTAAGINLTGNNFTFNSPVTTTNVGGVTITNSGLTNIAANADLTLSGAFLQNGAGAVALGGDITGSSIQFSSPLTLSDNVSINTSAGNGNIVFNNTVNAANAGVQNLSLAAGSGNIIFNNSIGNINRLGNLTVNSAGNLLSGAIAANSITQTSGTGTTTFNGVLETNSAAGINLTGNNFTFNSPVTTANSGGLSINNTGNLNIADNADLTLSGAFLQNGTSAVALNGGITGSSIQFSSPLRLTDNVSLNTSAGNGNIIFNNTVNAANAGVQSLTLAAGTGNISFNNSIGNINRLGNLTVNSAGNLLSGAIAANSITQTSGTGTTTFNGVLDTNSATGINLTGNNFTFNSPVTTANGGGLTINNSGTLNLAAGANLNLDEAFLQTGTGAVSLVGNITTNNQDIRFSGPVTLNGNVIFNLGSATVAFGSSLAAGNNPLTLTAGEIDFTGPVTGNSTLVLSATSPAQAITLGGTNNSTSALDLTADELAALANGFSSITIGSIDGSGTINVESGAPADIFKDPLTLLSPAGTINVNGLIGAVDNASVTLNAANINLENNITTQNQNITLSGDISLNNNVELNTDSGGGDIILNGSVNGIRELFLNAGSGNVEFNGSIGQLRRLEVNAQNTLLPQGDTLINTSSGDILFNSAVTLRGNTRFDAGTGTIGFKNTLTAGSNDLTLTADEINFTAITGTGNLVLQPTTANLDITLAGTGDTNALDLTAAEINGLQDAFNSITIGRENSSGAIRILNDVNFNSALTIQSPISSGSITANGAITGSGIELRAGNNITTANITSARNIFLTSNSGEIDTSAGTLTTSAGGEIRLNAAGNIKAGEIISASSAIAGGDIRLDSMNGSITTENLNASSTNADGGDVELRANNEIKTGNITTHSDSNAGGKITLESQRGAIESGNLDASGNTQGGAIKVLAPVQITAGEINSSARLGNAGNVTLDPDRDIQVSFINAQGGSQGIGGTVDITTKRFFRATGTFIDRNGTVSSISTAGGRGGGPITIRHGGGPDTAFTVVGGLTNGTASNITTGAGVEETVQPGDYFGPFTQGRVGVITAPVSPPPPPPPPTPTPTPTPISTPTPTPVPTPISAPVPTPVPAPSPTPMPVLLPTPTPIPSFWTDSTVTGGVSTSLPNAVLTVPGNTSAPILDTTSAMPNSVSAPTLGITSAVPDSKSAPTLGSSSAVVTAPISTQPEAEVDTTENSNDTEKVSFEYTKIRPKLETSGGKATLAFDTTPQLRENLEQALKNGKLNTAISLIEQLRTEEFKNYFGENSSGNTGLAESEQGINPGNTKEAVSIEQIQKTLTSLTDQTGRTPAVVYVFAQPEQLYLILVGPKSKPILKSLPEANRGALLKMVQAFRLQVSNPQKSHTTEYLASSQKLYRWLIAPMEAELKAQGIDTLVFSLDTGVRSLPVAALHDGDKFLVEKYTIGLIPSINLVDTRYADIRNFHVLAMGASRFTDQKALPSVPVELSMITKQLWQGKSFLNEGFTLENLKLERAKEPFGIIHLATHGQFQPRSPAHSYIQLWDAQLRLDQLRQMGWNDPPVELLVLSACRTALGDEQAELGFGGLAVAAGVKSALGSLWYVSDLGTLGLMTEFYQHLKNAPIKAEALQQAQIAMIQGRVRVEGNQLHWSASGSKSVPVPAELGRQDDQDFSHPFYWASFTLIGSPW